jgi:hypothetical protein
MASKKKTPSAADFRKKEEADKKKMKTSSSGPTYNGKKVDWKTPGKPTEAITNKGQKATGLSKPTTQDRFSSTAKTKLSTGPFANSGNPNSKQFNVTKGNVANAAFTVVASPASVGKGALGPVTSAVVKKVEKYVGGKALPVLAQGLDKSGAGGKLYGALTPEGVAIASTRIGSAAQQSARMGNLTKNAINKSTQIAMGVGDDVIRGINMAGKVVKVGAAGALIANTLAPNKKKKK